MSVKDEFMKTANVAIDSYNKHVEYYGEARRLESRAIYELFKAYGMILDETKVRNKKTGAVGYLRLVEDGRSVGHFFSVAFYPVCKDGKISKVRSWKDSPDYKYVGFSELGDAERFYKEAENAVESYEVAQ